MKWLLVLLAALPFVELYLLLEVGRRLGWAVPLTLIIVSALTGALLAKREGFKAWRKGQEALAQGRLPEEGLASGALILLGGVLLLVPGLITDVLGGACLFPPTRRHIVGLLRQRFEQKLRNAAPRSRPVPTARSSDGTQRPGQAGDVIDVEARPANAEDNAPKSFPRT